jgi:hypothetical protein
MSQLLTNDNVIKDESDNIHDIQDRDTTFIFPFAFDLPPHLHSCIAVKHGQSHYHVKAYITDDPYVFMQFKKDMTLLDEFVSRMNHTFCKQDVQVVNARVLSNGVYTDDNQVFDAKTNNFKIFVTLPKLTFAKGEVIPIHVLIKHANDHDNDNKHHLDLHKIGFKLVEFEMLTATFPAERVRINENVIAHKKRRRLHENKSHEIIVEEDFELPKICHGSTCRIIPGKNHFHHLHHESNHAKHYFTNLHVDSQYPIKIEYKLCLEFWKSFLKDELNINIPIAISPQI